MSDLVRRIGALGDIHTEDDALFTALAFLRAQELDAIVSVGDIVDGRGDADRCCALLRDAGVLAVRGNHERWFLKDTMRDLRDVTHAVHDAHRGWLASLPATRRFETPAGTLLLCHGIGDDDMAVLRSDTDAHSLAWLEPLHRVIADRSLDLMLAGHTHERMVRRFDGLTVINAGTLHRDFAPGFVIVDFVDGVVRGFDLDGTDVLEAEREPLVAR